MNLEMSSEAKEIMPLLEYSKWENFHKVIKRAMIACETSNNSVNDHFPEFRKPIVIPKGASKKVINYKLSEDGKRLYTRILVNNNNKYF